ncbi:TolC family protein [Deinococcus sp.]|uniref:TolC family protein n=1 Tax=Deinococcus sp. TaxID=47478 RepID=UPI0025C1987C|nr:TolC family protein [Deinococcus sp.]
MTHTSRFLKTTALLLSLSAASAQAATLSLASALAKSGNQPNVIAARTALSNAQSEYAKAKADPLATKVTLLRAQQAYELAVASVKSADTQADAQIAQAYTQVLEAQDGVSLATQALDLATKAAKVAQTQYAKGGGTQIAAQVAQNQAAAAQQTLNTARDGLNLATSNLMSLVGPFTSVAPIPASAVPDNVSSSVVDTVVARNPAYIQAQQGSAALQLQLNLADPIAVSASQINALKTQLQQTQSAAQNASRGLRIQTQGLYNSYLQAIKNRSVKLTALQNAERQYAADQARYAKGLISQLALLQSQIAYGQAKLAREQADDSVLTAYYNLLAGTPNPSASAGGK